MRREFSRERWGTKYVAVVTVAVWDGRKQVQGVLNFRTGFGGGSRRLEPVFIDGDDLGRVEAGLRCEDAMPGWMLADVLEEVAGWDAGFTDVLREAQ